MSLVSLTFGNHVPEGCSDILCVCVCVYVCPSVSCRIVSDGIYPYDTTGIAVSFTHYLQTFIHVSISYV